MNVNSHEQIFIPARTDNSNDDSTSTWRTLGKPSPEILRSGAWLLTGALLGATAGYYLDPLLGRRRRALISDQIVHWQRTVAFHSARKGRDYRNRLIGLTAEAMGWMKASGGVNDDLLVSRVRSKFGRKVSHPGAIHIEARDGLVTLRGNILQAEVNELLESVSHVRGVRGVENQLRIHETAGRVPSLQD